MTIRTLVLLRHAKAANPDAYATDAERPLTTRGRADAAAAGAWLKASGYEPDQVLCSSAARTRETWQAVSTALGEAPVIFEQGLYLTLPQDVLELVSAAPATAGNQLVIGHNPTMTMLSHLLDPDGLTQELSTSALAVHRLDGEWSDFSDSTAPLVDQHAARG